MEERMRFLSRLREGERISDLCREFEISRKTAYKFVKRYEANGVLGLVDQRRRPERIPHRTSEEVKRLIVELRRKHSTWGPKKLQHVLRKKHPGVRIPALSTIGDILVREKLIVRKRRRKHEAPTEYATLSSPTAPNDLWCIDFKGQFRLGNGELCYPLTLTDATTRYILACEAFARIDGGEVRSLLEQVFTTVGIPKAMRFDGGPPFASQGLMRLSRLSAWFLSLGIKLEQIEPASPQQNGRHERMHRTLKAETTRPAAARLLQQQERFDGWVASFNHERPHEALGMKCPAELYVASMRPYAPTRRNYPLHDQTLRVSSRGRIRFRNGRRGDRQYFISESLEGLEVGVRELDDGRWLVTFCDLDLGVIDRIVGDFTPFTATSANESTTTEIDGRNNKQPTRTASATTDSTTKETNQRNNRQPTKAANANSTTKEANQRNTRQPTRAANATNSTTKETNQKNNHQPMSQMSNSTALTTSTTHRNTKHSRSATTKQTTTTRKNKRTTRRNDKQTERTRQRNTTTNSTTKTNPRSRQHHLALTA
jgi:transposase InsO family protein